MIEPSQLDIFEDLTPEEFSLVRPNLRIRRFDAGECVSEQDSLKKELCVVLTGVISGTQKLPGTIERKHGRLKPGDFFGECSVFGNKPNFVTYIAAEKSELLVIQESCFLSLMEKNPEAATRLIARLLSRTIGQFRSSSSFLADVVQWGENASRRVITDEMTGIYNRAFLEDAMENFFNISKSNSKPLSLLMMDIDNCRVINGKLGLEAGNSVIREFADIVKGIISKHGIAARYGGDEFCILLPETAPVKAKVLAERIRSEVEAHDFSKLLGGEAIPVTTSIGICSFPESTREFSEFKGKADEALYKAKEGGKNRIEWI